MTLRIGQRDLTSWLTPVAAIAMVGVSAAILTDNDMPAWPPALVVVGLLILAAALSVLALSQRVASTGVVVLALIGVGLCGAGLDWWSDGGLIVGYVALVGLMLRVPRRVAIMAATPVVVAIAVAEAHDSRTPVTAFVQVLLGFGFLFLTSAFAAVSLDARRRAETLLAQEGALRAQEAATSQAREEAAALAERSRLARELHDVLAHSLAALAVELEDARMMAIGAGAGTKLVGKIGFAHQLTRIGMLNARNALQTLREDDPPALAGLPGLVSQSAAAAGMHISFRTVGTARPLAPDAARTVYRVVQESLTNVAKHAGHGACAAVQLRWSPTEVEVTVADSGGDGVDANLPSSGFGLTSMAERAASHGAQLDAGPTDGGFTVRLRLPLHLASPEPSDDTR